MKLKEFREELDRLLFLIDSFNRMSMDLDRRSKLLKINNLLATLLDKCPTPLPERDLAKLKAAKARASKLEIILVPPIRLDKIDPEHDPKKLYPNFWRLSNG